MCFSLRRADAGRLNRFSEKFQNFLRTLRQNSAIARAMALTPSDRNTAFTRTGSLTRNKMMLLLETLRLSTTRDRHLLGETYIHV